MMPRGCDERIRVFVDEVRRRPPKYIVLDKLLVPLEDPALISFRSLLYATYSQDRDFGRYVVYRLSP